MPGTPLSREDADRQADRVILIVEDDVLIRLLVADHLREAGFGVVEATNAAEAIAVIASKARVDLVFTDHDMPGEMDGESLAHWLRSRRPELPVILTSGSFRPSCATPHWARFLAKPYVLIDVERHIRELLN